MEFVTGSDLVEAVSLNRNDSCRGGSEYVSKSMEIAGQVPVSVALMRSSSDVHCDPTSEEDLSMVNLDFSDCGLVDGSWNRFPGLEFAENGDWSFKNSCNASSSSSDIVCTLGYSELLPIPMFLHNA